jgi:hypothetical protein
MGAFCLHLLSIPCVLSISSQDKGHKEKELWFGRLWQLRSLQKVPCLT